MYARSESYSPMICICLCMRILRFSDGTTFSGWNKWIGMCVVAVCTVHATEIEWDESKFYFYFSVKCVDGAVFAFSCLPIACAAAGAGAAAILRNEVSVIFIFLFGKNVMNNDHQHIAYTRHVKNSRANLTRFMSECARICVCVCVLRALCYYCFAADGEKVELMMTMNATK